VSLSTNKSDVTPAGPQIVKELVVQNKMGIHARPAAMIVRITNKFKSEVFVEKDEASGWFQIWRGKEYVNES